MGIIRATRSSTAHAASASQLHLQRQRAEAALYYQQQAQTEMSADDAADYQAQYPEQRDALDVSLHIASHTKRIDHVEHALGHLSQSVQSMHQKLAGERARTRRQLTIMASCFAFAVVSAAIIPLQIETHLMDAKLDSKLQKAMAGLSLGNPALASMSAPTPVAAAQPAPVVAPPAPLAAAPQVPVTQNLTQNTIPLAAAPPSIPGADFMQMATRNAALGTQVNPAAKKIETTTRTAAVPAPPPAGMRVSNVFTPFQNAVRSKMARNGELIPADWQPMFDREATGDMKGKLQVAAKFLKGEGVSRDQAFAVQLIKEAAEAGEKEALMWLGYAYQAGNLGRVDLPGAAHWFEMAGKAGVAKAYTELGRIYETGIDGAPDTDLALAWYQRAAAGGDTYAAASITRLTSNTKPAPPVAVAAAPRPPVQAAPLMQPASAAPLSDDGQVTNVAAAMPITPPPMEEGSATSSAIQASSDVRAAQRMLKALGYKIGTVDGMPGPQTSVAVKSYQHTKMLTQDGEVTPQLMENLMNDMRWGN